MKFKKGLVSFSKFWDNLNDVFNKTMLLFMFAIWVGKTWLQKINFSKSAGLVELIDGSTA
jgi:hypothetical protein